MAELYHQLAMMNEAGLPLVQALKTLGTSRGLRSARSQLLAWATSIERGNTFSEAMTHARGNIPEFDLALLHAGEQSGRLDTCFKILSDYYDRRAQNIRTTRNHLAYPALIVHAAVFIIPFPAFFQSGDLNAYLSGSLGLLLPLYLILFLISWAFDGARALAWRRIVETGVRLVPLLGSSLKFQALSRFCLALESLLNAGVGVSQSWCHAAVASGSPALESEVQSFPEALEQGITPSEWLEQAGFFPDLFKMSYAAGETSGRLDENLRRLRGVYEEEGARKLQAFSLWLPRLVYFSIVIIMAYHILTFYAGYYGGMIESINP
jgi:type II secretory pathway component PulF